MSTVETNQPAVETNTNTHVLPDIQGINDPVIRMGIHVLFQKHQGQGVEIVTGHLHAKDRQVKTFMSEAELVDHLAAAKPAQREIIVASVRRVVNQAMQLPNPTESADATIKADASLRTVGGWRKSI